MEGVGVVVDDEMDGVAPEPEPGPDLKLETDVDDGNSPAPPALLLLVVVVVVVVVVAVKDEETETRWDVFFFDIIRLAARARVFGAMSRASAGSTTTLVFGFWGVLVDNAAVARRSSSSASHSSVASIVL
jgi:hypothetical protein